MSDRSSEGPAPDRRTPSGLINGTRKGYAGDGGNQALMPDPWTILAGEAEADDVDRVLAILDGLEGREASL